MSTLTTKRKYAHEIYPHGNGWDTRPLAVEVPYLYARALGLGVWGTEWFAATPKESGDRTSILIAARQVALLSDALLQGLTGDEAWAWADERMDESGEWIWERAVHYGVNPKAIKPYKCGPKPKSHDHMASTGDSMGEGVLTRVDGREDECAACCEPEATR